MKAVTEKVTSPNLEGGFSCGKGQGTLGSKEANAAAARPWHKDQKRERKRTSPWAKETETRAEASDCGVWKKKSLRRRNPELLGRAWRGQTTHAPQDWCKGDL